LKLRKLAYAVKNSTTLLLPKWFSILKDLNVSECMMPRDVTTRWNSTFDMLNFAIQYQKAIQIITSNLDFNLRQYELSREEWKIAVLFCPPPDLIRSEQIQADPSRSAQIWTCDIGEV
jgi:hypothetical protein